MHIKPPAYAQDIVNYSMKFSFIVISYVSQIRLGYAVVTSNFKTLLLTKTEGYFSFMLHVSCSTVKNQLHLTYSRIQVNQEAVVIGTLPSPVIMAKRKETVVKQELAFKTSSWK